MRILSPNNDSIDLPPSYLDVPSFKISHYNMTSGDFRYSYGRFEGSFTKITKIVEIKRPEREGDIFTSRGIETFKVYSKPDNFFETIIADTRNQIEYNLYSELTSVLNRLRCNITNSTKMSKDCPITKPCGLKVGITFPLGQSGKVVLAYDDKQDDYKIGILHDQYILWNHRNKCLRECFVSFATEGNRVLDSMRKSPKF